MLKRNDELKKKIESKSKNKSDSLNKPTFVPEIGPEIPNFKLIHENFKM